LVTGFLVRSETDHWQSTMDENETLNLLAHEVAGREMRPGERLIWAGRPEAGALAWNKVRSTSSEFIPGTVFLVIGIFFMFLAPNILWERGLGWETLFLGMLLLLIPPLLTLSGLGTLLAPVRAARRARTTVYPGFPRWIGVLRAPCTHFHCQISFLQRIGQPNPDGRDGWKKESAVRPAFPRPSGLSTRSIWGIRVYAISDRQLLIVNLFPRHRVRSFLPHDFNVLECTERADGSGDVVFREVTKKSSYMWTSGMNGGGSYSPPKVVKRGFFGVPEVRRVEAEIRRLAAGAVVHHPTDPVQQPTAGDANGFPEAGGRPDRPGSTDHGAA
jgi:hypothetical protein